VKKGVDYKLSRNGFKLILEAEKNAEEIKLSSEMINDS
jgi:hypothetical protein